MFTTGKRVRTSELGMRNFARIIQFAPLPFILMRRLLSPQLGIVPLWLRGTTPIASI